MKDLTKAEEYVMLILWKIEKGFVKDIISHFEDPKPAYNTVSTIVRILETKGFIAHKEYGKSHRYFPLIKKKEYSFERMNEIVKNYFANSASQVVSFLIKNKKIDINEVDELIKMSGHLKGKSHE